MTQADRNAVVGKGIERLDGRAKVTGKAAYAAEIAVANVAHAVIVGSRAPLGRIASIDAAAAAAAPGVLRIFTHENAPRLPLKHEGAGPPLGQALQLLQDDQIHYADQPVALVVADSLENARAAADLVKVSYEERTPLLSLEDNAKSAYAPRELVRGPTDSARGDFERAFAEAPVRVEATYRTPVQNHNPMEMHATIAVWQGEDRVTIYDSTQGIFNVRKTIAAAFGIPPDHVRVIALFVGGGFGSKGRAWSHVTLTALAARALGRPVKLMVTRPQMFALVGHRPPTVQRLSLAADFGGKLVAVRHDLLSETSRFDDFAEPSATVSRMLYASPNTRTSHRIVRLDVPTPTFMRAPGESTGSYAIESAMDELSYALRLDPLELRLRNYAELDPDSGKPWSSKSLLACYREAAARFGWSRRPQRVRARREGHKLVGWGMATASYPAGQSAASAIARVRADGTALVQSGSQDIGTGTYTVMAQIAADGLGLPMAKVRFELGDTNLPEAPLSAGSRTASSVGSAVKMAALGARQKLIALAIADPSSPLAGLDAAGIQVSDGVLFAQVAPSRRDDYAAILKRARQAELVAEVTTGEHPDRKNYALHSFGAQMVEVEVDEDLGEARVTRMVGAFAGGKVLNALTARSQLLGAMVWGIGFALTEQTVRDPRTGRVVTRDLADYHLPVNADVPAIDVVMIDEYDPHVNDVGAKGLGEVGITGAVAAIANAVYHATGTRIRDLPITPDKLLQHPGEP
jgi:xanthine dehydrogenase YagR molybdenum-binding subunit